jgi:hypothetical protein
MNRFKNFLPVAALTAAMSFSLCATARANDGDRDHYADRHEQHEGYRARWRDGDGRSFRRVWDPYRGWVVEPCYPPPSQWQDHDRGRHLGSHKHAGREEHDGDGD